MTEKAMTEILQAVYVQLVSNPDTHKYYKAFEMAAEIYHFMTYDLGYSYSAAYDKINNQEFYF